jgi:uncharacterized protein YegL
MHSEERIKDMKRVVKGIVEAATMFDADGISLRFMNTRTPDDGSFDLIKDKSQVESIMSRISFSGGTPLGRQLRNKIIDSFVHDGGRKKPLLVITITDGCPSDENPISCPW